MIDYLGRAPSRRRLLAGDVPDWIKNSSRAPYIIRVVLSAPPWVDRKVLKHMQNEARRLTKETGHLHVLDHRVPLSHPNVCGLTVPWNLRIIHWRANLSKGNAWHPDQLPLFEDEE